MKLIINEVIQNLNRSHNLYTIKVIFSHGNDNATMRAGNKNQVSSAMRILDYLCSF